MLRVHRTDAEEIVLIHEPSETVVVDDTFDGALSRLRERLGDDFDKAVGPPPHEAPRLEAPPSPPWARWALLGTLVLLPFVWLGALHVSLGSLVVELRRDAIGDDDLAGAQAQDAADLREELDALGRRVDRLVDTVAKLKRGDPRRPSAADLVDEDEHEDEGDDDDDGGEAQDETEGDAPEAGPSGDTPQG